MLHKFFFFFKKQFILVGAVKWLDGFCDMLVYYFNFTSAGFSMSFRDFCVKMASVDLYLTSLDLLV